MPYDPAMSANELDAQLGELLRGVEHVYAVEELKRKLASGRRLRVKLGLDPTAPDIHLGHTVVLRKLRQFQDRGHLAVLVIGDYTARIGDPTGRDTTRPILDDAAIEHNARTYLDQAGRVLDLSPDRLEVRRNSEWLSALSFADVLRLTGQVTVQQMLHRENFRKRMESEREIVLSEFMYPLMQAYDSVMLHADVELGGTDQTFNNLMGRQLMEKRGMEKQVVMVMPLLVGLDGQEKMSKSKGNFIGVCDGPDEVFGKVMSVPDALMPNYFTLLTPLPADRIASLTDASRTHPREAKDVLGRAIVESLHDAGAAQGASDEFRRRFREGALPTDLATHGVSPLPMGLLDVMLAVGFAKSKTEARALVAQGAVSLDEVRVEDASHSVSIEPGGSRVLRVGKRRVCRLVPGA